MGDAAVPAADWLIKEALVTADWSITEALVTATGENVGFYAIALHLLTIPWPRSKAQSVDNMGNLLRCIHKGASSEFNGNSEHGNSEHIVPSPLKILHVIGAKTSTGLMP